MSAIITDPFGRPVVSQKRTVVITDPRLAKFAAFADDAFRKLELGVVCVHCQQPVVCNNAPTDTKWKIECACTVRVLTNPGVH